MSFWDVTKRMMQGKPAFETPQSADQWDDDAPTTDFSEDRDAKRAAEQAPPAPVQNGLVDEHGNKHIPVAAVINVRPDNSGASVELWATIKNQSDRELSLDKITLLGTLFRLNYPLAPGAQRVFKVYSGPQLTHDNYKKAELYYKDVPTGDYFRADHLLEYKYESDKTYDVNDMRLLMPINDV